GDGVQPVVFGPGSSWRPFAVKDHEPPAGLQRAKHRLHHPVVIAELMIGLNNQYRVEVIRESRVGALAKDRLYLPQLFAILTLPHFIDRLFVNVDRIDLAFSAHPSGQAKSEITEATADVRDAPPRLRAQSVHHFAGPLPHVPSERAVRFLR